MLSVCLLLIIIHKVNSLARGTREGLVGDRGITYKETYFNMIQKSQL